ncbi:MAG TPA: hypothetical protein VEF04_10930, partial [Blastocatellia bacterium]|nr:hypothetical protein [Blastocatellia bacterium]
MDRAWSHYSIYHLIDAVHEVLLLMPPLAYTATLIKRVMARIGADAIELLFNSLFLGQLFDSYEHHTQEAVEQVANVHWLLGFLSTFDYSLTRRVLRDVLWCAYSKCEQNNLVEESPKFVCWLIQLSRRLVTLGTLERWSEHFAFLRRDLLSTLEQHPDLRFPASKCQYPLMVYNE